MQHPLPTAGPTHAAANLAPSASPQTAAASPKTPATPTGPTVSERPPADSIAAAICEAALTLGFCRVGLTPVEPLARESAALRDWLEHEHHGEMAYMAAQPRDRPEAVLASARTLVVVALAYDRGEPPAPDAPGAPRGFVARYARGADYHHVLKSKLSQLATACETILGRSVLSRPCVDTAPLLERAYAARAGVGFIAKSTMAIAPGVGTYILLGELLLDVELPASAPLRSRCGQCTACLTACPTGAFVGPHVLDARRCISYLTIELRGSIPRALRPAIGNMILGCDRCQEVCPFNASPRPRPSAPELAAQPQLTDPDLCGLLQLGSAAYRKLVRASAWRRVSRPQLARNAAVALGNSGDRATLPALVQALQHHTHALVRGHAAWAIGRLGGDPALQRALAHETDAEVREEIIAALQAVGQP